MSFLQRLLIALGLEKAPTLKAVEQAVVAAVEPDVVNEAAKVVPPSIAPIAGAVAEASIDNLKKNL